MHRTRRTLLAAAVAAVAVLAAAGGAALAGPLAAPPAPVPRAGAERAQYHQGWGGPGFGDFDEHRWHRRQARRAYEEQRIAEAARREAWRIERERAERRAWRHAQRERYGYYRGF